MATLIGDGAHARDIMAVLPMPELWEVAPHHSDYDAGQLDDVIVGVNDPRLREKISEAIEIDDMAWIHPDAVIGTECYWKFGTHINYGVTMTRTTIGHHCTISPGVTICGDVSIGDRTLIGAGATICDRVTIGSDVMIGAGAVILPETVVPDGETWVGVPAKPNSYHLEIQ